MGELKSMPVPIPTAKAEIVRRFKKWQEMQTEIELLREEMKGLA
jgi:hypothetical protein